MVFQLFPMAANHWSNDGMVTIHRYGLIWANGQRHGWATLKSAQCNLIWQLLPCEQVYSGVKRKTTFKMDSYRIDRKQVWSKSYKIYCNHWYLLLNSSTNSCKLFFFFLNRRKAELYSCLVLVWVEQTCVKWACLPFRRWNTSFVCSAFNRNRGQLRMLVTVIIVS